MSGDLAGKVFLVTGATEGIGKAAAAEFAKRGASLVLVARNREKGERVVSELKKASANESVRLLVGDMSSIKDIRRVAAEFRQDHDSLDVLVNNAGAVFNDYKTSPDGFEMSFALNHLGYFGLTTLLLDLLQKTPGARVVSTSSAAHQMGKVDVSTIAKRDGRSAGFSAYGDSKLTNVLFTRELARKLSGSRATANCFHPGYVHTGFGLNNEGPVKWVLSLASPLFARTPEKGAETLVWLAASTDAAKHTGEYFHDKKVARVSKAGRDDDNARKLWAMSEALFA